jgi:hypothetical protein
LAPFIAMATKSFRHYTKNFFDVALIFTGVG